MKLREGQRVEFTKEFAERWKLKRKLGRIKKVREFKDKIFLEVITDDGKHDFINLTEGDIIISPFVYR